MPSLLSIRGIFKNYGDFRALHGVSLDIERGEYVAIMGPSGCGKSTLLHMIGLLDRPTEGTYELNGRDTGKMDDLEWAALRGKAIAFVFQFFNLIPRTSALENVELPLRYARIPNSAVRARAALEKVGLADRLHHTPAQLSGGQQQRVAIARALASEPWLLLADEPTGNVSSQQSGEILTLFERLHTDGGTIVLVTHDPTVAARAQRIVTMQDGKVVSDERKTGASHSSSTSPNENPSAKPLKHGIPLTDNLRMAWRALTRNKARTVLTMLGAMIGVASVVAMVALGAGARQAVNAQLSGMGARLLTIVPFPRGMGRRMAPTNLEISRLNLEDVKAIAALSIRGVPLEQVGAQILGNVKATYQGKDWNTRLVGASEFHPKLRNIVPQWGRFFTAEEVVSRARVCVIGETVIRNLFDENVDPVGSEIRINRNSFLVIGVLPRKGASNWQDEDNSIVVPITTGMFRILGKLYVDWIDVLVQNEADAPVVTTALETFLRKHNGLAPGQTDNFEIRNMAEIRQMMAQTTETISVLLGSIAAISLLVGGIGIMNIMLVSVKERTREIGLRMALGARRRDVLRQFLVEASMIGCFGGLVGMLIGATGSYFAGRIFGWYIGLNPHYLIFAVLFSTAVGAVFGYWPARQASDLRPVEALRYE